MLFCIIFFLTQSSKSKFLGLLDINFNLLTKKKDRFIFLVLKKVIFPVECIGVL